MPAACAAQDELTIADLSVNDISYLWPVPTSAAEIDDLLDATTAIGSSSIWPEENFQFVLDMALNKVVATDSFGGEHRIKIFDDALKERATWKLVGFRIDPSAPSTNPAVIDQIGSIPQIRLILQPITFVSGQVTVHDFTAHLPFNYVLNAAAPFQPNETAFAAILNDVLELKSFLLQSSGGISTDGVLQVNPGLANKVPGYQEKLAEFLDKHIASGILQFVAFMGIESPQPEPWLFFNVTLLPLQTETPTAQILFLRDSRRPAGPRIRGSNTNLGAEGGVNTGVLFERDAAAKLTDPAIAGHASPLINEIPNIIANPNFSNALNTDCVSCHSETTRRSILNIGDIDGFQYSATLGVQPDLLPTNNWNVRNFGWFMQDVDRGRG